MKIMHQKLCCIFCVRSKTDQYTTFHVITTPFDNDIKHAKKILKDLLFSRNLREIGNNGKFSLELFKILFHFLVTIRITYIEHKMKYKCTYFYTSLSIKYQIIILIVRKKFHFHVSFLYSCLG